MFSSNQILQISGDLRQKDDLRDALEYALKKEGAYECFTRAENPAKCTFQITEDGGYCIGWNYGATLEKGWTEFPFDFDVDIIASIIVKHLEKFEEQEFGWDGSSHKGYLLKNIEYNEPSVIKPFYGTLIFRPYTCFYAK